MRPSIQPLVRFFGWFALLYAVLIFPWPGGRELYSDYFCWYARAVHAEHSGNRILRFDTVPLGQRNRTLDLRITIANRTQLDANGSGRAVMLDLDSRGLGWVPTALLIALVLATPVAWPRRLKAVLFGLLAVHAFILLSIDVYIWNQSDASNGLNLVELSPFWKTIANGLEETLVTQLGASFAFPVLTWIFATLRTEDLRYASLTVSAALAKETTVTQK